MIINVWFQETAPTFIVTIGSKPGNAWIAKMVENLINLFLLSVLTQKDPIHACPSTKCQNFVLFLFY